MRDTYYEGGIPIDQYLDKDGTLQKILNILDQDEYSELMKELECFVRERKRTYKEILSYINLQITLIKLSNVF